MAKKKVNFFGNKRLTIPNLVIAYSFRKVNPSYYGYAIRVKRSSDNSEKDILFVNSQLDETDLLNFVGSNDAWVTRWYNQGSGAGAYASPISGNGYKIVVAGVIQTLNGKTTMIPDSGYYGFNMNVPGSTDVSIIWCGKYQANNNNFIYRTGSSGRFYFQNISDTELRFRVDGITAIFSGLTIDSTNQTINGMAYDINNSIRVDMQGVDLGTQPMTFAREVTEFLGGTKQVQEILVFDNNKQSELGDLCDEMNTYYGAY